MGPVVNSGSQESILEYIDKGISEGGRLVAGGTRAGDGGYFIRPTVIADVDPKGTIAQEEIFGPVLAVIKAKDFDDALQIANNTEFGLTGAVYTQEQEASGPRREGVLRRQSLPEPEVHRCAGRRRIRSADST